jgi:hypothetical protein
MLSGMRPFVLYMIKPVYVISPFNFWIAWIQDAPHCVLVEVRTRRVRFLAKRRQLSMDFQRNGGLDCLKPLHPGSFSA